MSRFAPSARSRAAALAGAALMCSSAAVAGSIEVSFENLASDDGGFFFTPVWGAFHNGEFDVYTSGEPASNFPGLEELAEDGNNDVLSEDFNASSAAAAGGVDFTLPGLDVGPPPINPGETATTVIDTGDTTVNRYFSYASMLIPTNDIFVANANPLAHEVYDEDGAFAGDVVIEIFGSSLRDAGTEVNDITAGAAFSALGGDPSDENGVITTFNNNPALADYLVTINGTPTVAGTTIDADISGATPLARITLTNAEVAGGGDDDGPAVVPTPSAAVAGLALMGLVGARRRRA